ncbi:MAG TPA: MarR family transcriptional regulator [Candidatus Eisenbacteria bacterium]|nr:MarR family transcriptional regulator [Candidatus Eisenbacteria bacterium]
MQTLERTTPTLAPRDPRLAPWRAFMRAHAQLARRLDEDLRTEHGLSHQEYVALLFLAESPDRRLRMGRLAEVLILSKSGATRLIDRLVVDGLVERLSCPSDARGAEAQLTEGGLDRLRAAAPTHLRGIADYFLSAIDQPDLEVIQRAMTDVADRICAAPEPARSAPRGTPAEARQAAR